jgi:general secretion pathway protein J
MAAAEPGKPTPSGFTLLELLVALVIMALLVAGMAAGVRYGLRAWSHETAMARTAGDLDTVDRTLRLVLATSDPGTRVTGADGSIAWTGFLPAGRGRADMVLIVDADHDLVLRWTPHPHAENLMPASAFRQDVLLGGVAGLSLLYWQDIGSAGWHAAWQAQSMPRLIRIHLRFSKGDNQDWPDIVVRTDYSR